MKLTIEEKTAITDLKEILESCLEGKDIRISSAQKNAIDRVLGIDLSKSTFKKKEVTQLKRGKDDFKIIITSTMGISHPDTYGFFPFQVKDFYEAKRIKTTNAFIDKFPNTELYFKDNKKPIIYILEKTKQFIQRKLMISTKEKYMHVPGIEDVGYYKFWKEITKEIEVNHLKFSHTAINGLTHISKEKYEFLLNEFYKMQGNEITSTEIINEDEGGRDRAVQIDIDNYDR